MNLRGILDLKYDENDDNNRAIKATGNIAKTIKAKIPTENVKESSLTIKPQKAKNPASIVQQVTARQESSKIHKVLNVDPDFYKEFRFLERSSKSTVPGQVY